MCGNFVSSHRERIHTYYLWSSKPFTVDSVASFYRCKNGASENFSSFPNKAGFIRNFATELANSKVHCIVSTLFSRTFFVGRKGFSKNIPHSFHANVHLPAYLVQAVVLCWPFGMRLVINSFIVVRN